tara:strand:+ start:96 stop:299 length:204 start_codon:yes stop_codon:yes gene_type:complete
VLSVSVNSVGDLLGYAISRFSNRVVGQVGIAFGRCCLGVTQKAANDGEGETQAGGNAGVGVPQVMNP